jgi:hypothetical protein
MKRELNVSQVLKSFEGKEIKRDGVSGDVFTLRDGLLGYLRNASGMGLTPHEENIAYTLGFLVGPAEGKVELTTEQYDVIKKICDNGKSKNVQGQETNVYSIEIQYQIKEMVDRSTPKDTKPLS